MTCQVQPGFPQHKKSLEFEREQGDRRQEAQAYLESGETYRSENKNQKAIEQYEKAINIARKQGDKLCETIAYLKLGETYRSDNKNQIAITQYENSLEIARKQEYKLHETIAYVRLGESYRSDNTNEKAIQQYEKALEIARKQGYKLQIAIAYLGLGEAYKSDCQNQKTFEYNRKALEIAKEQGYKLRKTQAYIGLGHAYRFDNNNQEAIRHYEKALETARKQGYKLEETQAYLGLAEAHKVHSQNERAIQHYAKALEIANEKGYKQEKDHAYVGLTEALTASKELSGFADAVDEHYGAIANVPDSIQLPDTKHKNNDSDDRLDMKNESSTDDRTISKQQLFTGHSNPDGGKNEYVIVTVPLANKRERKDSKVKAYQQWGNTVTRKGEYKKGVEYYEKARKISPDLRPDEMEVAAYQWLGYNQLQAGQYQESIKYYSAVVTFATLLGDKRRKLNAYLGLGGALIYTGNFKSSQKYYQEALKIAKELCDKRCEGISYLGLGSVCNKEFDYENAEKWFKDAEHIFQTKHNDESLKGKAFMGSRIAKFNPKNTQKETKTIPRAGNIYKDKTKKETSVSWKWKKKSKIHRQKFEYLCQHAKKHPEKIQEINGVRVCCAEQFLLGRGSDGTRVYVGLGRDGVERAVKRLHRDACHNLAEQEKDVLNELSRMKSNHVLNYWYLEKEHDKDYLFLIVDLCEETLENFVHRSSVTDVVKNAPDIIRQVLKGLADLHRGPNPILHRDLKPSNILRDVDDNWLLADFGISRILAAGVKTHLTKPSGTEDWKAVESCTFEAITDDDESGKVRCKKESDIQVAGMVAFYILTKGEHPFGDKPDRLRNLLDGEPVGLADKLMDDAAKDLISWMLSHDPYKRPSAEEALKHPYLQNARQQFEMLSEVGNQLEIKARDVSSDVVQKLNSNPKDWRNEIAPDILKYLSIDCSNRRHVFYRPLWTDCLRLIRNVKQHWKDRPSPRPEAFYTVEDPQKYFPNLFPSLCVEVHKIIRSCDWKERDDLKEYFT